MELPPNATEVELALNDAIQPRVDLKPGINEIRGLKLEAPDNFLPFLIWEYGLGEILYFLEDPRQAIKEGIKWQRLRGTEAGLRLALSWIGMEGSYTEEEGPGAHFAEFQLDSGNVPKNETNLIGLLKLAKLSIPARSHLSRIFHKYDIRRHILNDSDYGALLSDNSGVHLEGFPILSFGRESAFSELVIPPQIIRVLDREYSVRGHYEDRALLDVLLLGDNHLINHESAHSHLFTSECGPLEIETTKNINVFCKAEIVLSDSDPLGWTNACFAGFLIKEEGEALVLDESELDDRYVVIKTSLDERFDPIRGNETVNGYNLQPIFTKLSCRFDLLSPLSNFPILSEEKPLINHPVVRIPNSSLTFTDPFYSGLRYSEMGYGHLTPEALIRPQDQIVRKSQGELFTNFLENPYQEVSISYRDPVHSIAIEMDGQFWTSAQWPSSAWEAVETITGNSRHRARAESIEKIQDLELATSRDKSTAYHIQDGASSELVMVHGLIRSYSVELGSQHWINTSWPNTPWSQTIVIAGNNHSHLHSKSLVKPQDHQLVTSQKTLFVYFVQGGLEKELVSVHGPIRTSSQEMDSQFWTDSNWPDSSWNQTETIIGMNHERSN